MSLRKAYGLALVLGALVGAVAAMALASAVSRGAYPVAQAALSGSPSALYRALVAPQRFVEIETRVSFRGRTYRARNVVGCRAEVKRRFCALPAVRDRPAYGAAAIRISTDQALMFAVPDEHCAAWSPGPFGRPPEIRETTRYDRPYLPVFVYVPNVDAPRELVAFAGRYPDMPTPSDPVDPMDVSALGFRMLVDGPADDLMATLPFLSDPATPPVWHGHVLEIVPESAWRRDRVLIAALEPLRRRSALPADVNARAMQLDMKLQNVLRRVVTPEDAAGLEPPWSQSPTQNVAPRAEVYGLRREAGVLKPAWFEAVKVVFYPDAPAADCDGGVCVRLRDGTLVGLSDRHFVYDPAERALMRVVPQRFDVRAYVFGG